MTDKLPNDSKGGLVSVSAMAAWVKLSRDRFYDLVRSGVFPPPVYDVTTRRPRYTEELQQMCLRIKESGIGFNGRLVLFNRKHRSRRSPRTPRSSRESSPTPTERHERDSVEARTWAAQLGHLGITATLSEVAAALKSCCPQGTTDVEDSEILRRLCRQLRRHNQ